MERNVKSRVTHGRTCVNVIHVMGAQNHHSRRSLRIHLFLPMATICAVAEFCDCDEYDDVSQVEGWVELCEKMGRNKFINPAP